MIKYFYSDSRILLVLLIYLVYLFNYSFSEEKSIDGCLQLYIAHSDLSLAHCEVEVSNLMNKTPTHLTPFFFEKLPINSASSEALESVTGIGSYLAGNIIEYRKNYGPIKGAKDLQNVRGIGPSRSSHLSNYLSFCE